MSKITQIIDKANFEIVRSKIAAILSDEFANQKALNQAALGTETDPAVIEALNLNISAIPDKTWEERFVRPQAEEYTVNPVVNVAFVNAPLNDLQTVSTQNADDTFIIEVYSGHREPTEEDPDYKGDSLAAIKLQRCLAIVRGILMYPEYARLGFDTLPYFIGKVSVNSIQISQPDEGADNSRNLIYGRLTLTVKISEGVQQVSGVLESDSESTYKLDDTKGYYWTTQSY
jgi:hypothetical protein